MRSIIEAYVGVWSILLLIWIAIAFTGINMNVAQARKTYNDICAELQACNCDFTSFSAKHGGSVDSNGNYTSNIYKGTGYKYQFTVEFADVDRKYSANNETFIYNDLYKIKMNYDYGVALFGTFSYPQVGYVS